MAELLFRVPTLDDLEGVLALMNDPRSVHRQIACRHGETPEPAGQLYDRLDEDDNLVATFGSELVGFASWQAYGRHVHLNVLSVSGAHQRAGIGQALFDAFRRAAREHGATSFSLRAYRDSEWAIRFYARQGLTPTTAVAELCKQDAGFGQYMALAIANGQWPAAEKVLFFGRLA